MASFRAVHYVVFFEEDTPEALIRELSPDVLIKGGDYQMDEVVGREIVWDAGGEVVLCAPLQNRSTSAIIRNIIERFT